MSRPAGARNPDFAERRRRLTEAVAARMVEPGGPEASLRELAEAAGVSVPTLRHYFGDRDGAVAAAMEVIGARGGPWLVLTADPGEGDARASLTTFLTLFVVGWRRFGVGRLHAASLAAGLLRGPLGAAYLGEVLEPVQQAVEARIGALMARGDLASGDVRLAALQLLAPVILALLHQDALDGARCRPLDVDAFVAGHLDRFLLAWRA